MVHGAGSRLSPPIGGDGLVEVTAGSGITVMVILTRVVVVVLLEESIVIMSVIKKSNKINCRQ